MTLRGRVENGSIVLDQDFRLPQGTEVRVKVLGDVSPQDGVDGSNRPAASVFDRLKHVIGTVEALPPDFAANHDHYVHGTLRVSSRCSDAGVLRDR